MYIIDLLLDESGNITREGILSVLAFVFALITALVLHELAHALVAFCNGDDTAKVMGRMSLNPLKHFDVFGFLMMLVVGFGWAKPVPVNPNKFRRRNFGMATVSVAGVVTNFLIAFFFCLFYMLMTKTRGAIDMANSEGALYYLWYFLASLFLIGASLNISFALFNLLPLYPLDGYRVLSCFVRQENAVMSFLRRYSLYILLGLIALDYIPFLKNLSPLNLYIGELGGLIFKGFNAFWGLFFI